MTIYRVLRVLTLIIVLILLTKATRKHVCRLPFILLDKPDKQNGLEHQLS